MLASEKKDFGVRVLYVDAVLMLIAIVGDCLSRFDQIMLNGMCSCLSKDRSNAVETWRGGRHNVLFCFSSEQRLLGCSSMVRGRIAMVWHAQLISFHAAVRIFSARRPRRHFGSSLVILGGARHLCGGARQTRGLFLISR